MWDHHKLGVCRPSQESVVRNLKIGDLKLYSFRAEIFPSPKGHGENDLADGGCCCTEDNTMERSPTGAQQDLDNPIWSKVFRNKMFRELPPSRRIRLSLTSLMMGQTMRDTAPALVQS
jgi:hypothetical protein